MKITCGTCKEEWQCMTGCGISHARLQDVASEFPEETEREIARKVKGERFPFFEFAYHVSRCDQCDDMVSIPVLKLPDSGAEYIGTCPVCKSEVKPVVDLGAVSCPACGGKTLTAESVGNWD